MNRFPLLGFGLQRWVAALLGWLLVAAPGGAESISEEARARAQGALGEAVAKGKAVGVAHLVVVNGKRVHAAMAGDADRERQMPMRLDSVQRIYSMTKPITTVGAMRLYEQGKFGLDDPVARYLPAFAEVKVLSTGGVAAPETSLRRPITIRDVLCHRTGYSYGDESSVRAAYEREGMRYEGPWEMFPPRMTIAKAADALARLPVLHQPGDRFTYGFSTDLLGRLIEVWSEQPLDVFLRQAVFEPLEMKDAGFAVRGEGRARFTTCYALKDGRFVVADDARTSPFNDGFEFLSGGGGLVSTVEDYANFCQMLVDGGRFKERRVLRGETVELMFTDQLHGAADGFRFGLGFEIAEAEVGSGENRRKVLRYSWGGYASTAFQIIPSLGMFQVAARQLVPYAPEFDQELFQTILSGMGGDTGK